MLNIARKTFKRVPSFQDLLQGRMTHPDMYVALFNPPPNSHLTQCL